MKVLHKGLESVNEDFSIGIGVGVDNGLEMLYSKGADMRARKEFCRRRQLVISV